MARSPKPKADSVKTIYQDTSVSRTTSDDLGITLAEAFRKFANDLDTVSVHPGITVQNVDCQIEYSNDNKRSITMRAKLRRIIANDE